jgi:hypothetical protein
MCDDVATRFDDIGSLQKHKKHRGVVLTLVDREVPLVSSCIYCEWWMDDAACHKTRRLFILAYRKFDAPTKIVILCFQWWLFKTQQCSWLWFHTSYCRVSFRPITSKIQISSLTPTLRGVQCTAWSHTAPSDSQKKLDEKWVAPWGYTFSSMRGNESRRVQ